MSPKFKFKFDNVLKHRKILEDKEAKELYKRNMEYEEAVNKLKNLENKYENTQKELTEKEDKGIDISELKTYYAYMNSLKLEIKAQVLKVKDAEQKKEIQRKKLIEAQRNKKVIDKLKEKKLTEFNEEERKNDIKIIDDINSVAEARKRNL